MGGAPGTRLADTPTVYDLGAGRVRPLVVKSARPAGSESEAATIRDYDVTSFNSPEIAGVAVFGSGGVDEGDRFGILIFDMSSIDHDASTASSAHSTGMGPG